MANGAIPDGALFSRAYLSGGPRQHDSDRFRRRIAAYVNSVLIASVTGRRGAIARQIELEIGVAVPYFVPSGDYDLGGFFQNSTTAIRDVLDAVTLIYEFLGARGSRSDAMEWRNFVARVFEEQGMGYRLDEKGGVRYFVDEEFERNRFSLIDALDDARWIAVKNYVDAAYARLDGVPKDTKAAVRDIFEAAETFCKVLTGSGRDLTESFVTSTVGAWVQSVLSHETGAAASATGRRASR